MPHLKIVAITTAVVTVVMVVIEVLVEVEVDPTKVLPIYPLRRPL